MWGWMKGMAGAGRRNEPLLRHPGGGVQGQRPTRQAARALLQMRQSGLPR